MALIKIVSAEILDAAIEKLAKGLTDKFSSASKVDINKLKKAIISALIAADEKVDLFASIQPSQIPTFLDNVFNKLGLQELERPFNNRSVPDRNYIINNFIEEFHNYKIENYALNFSQIELWLDAFLNTYFEEVTNYIKILAAKAEYLKKIVDWYDDVKFAGVAVPGQETERSQRLEHIFVIPDVEEEIHQKQSYREVWFSLEDQKERKSRNKNSSFLFTGLDAQAQQRLAQLRSGQLPRLEQKQEKLPRVEQEPIYIENPSARRFLAAHLLSQSQAQKIVILGAPGSGKTTLMSYFAVKLAIYQSEDLGLDKDKDWLPILIRIRDLTRQPDISILDYLRYFAEKTLAVKTLPTGFFEYWLEEGRALVLLDGLDEVAELSKRYEVVRQIERFLAQFSQNRAIITSRPTGYRRDFFLKEDIPHYQLQPFDDDKIEQFINRWYDSRIFDPEEAQRRKDSLKKAIFENRSIKQLGRNPLLLTIITLIHRYQAHLPKERYKLYDKAVETLLTAWDANKELSDRILLKNLGLSDVRRLLERLAYWIHSQGSTGNTEGGTLINCEELNQQLSRYIKEQKQIPISETELEAKRFVEYIKERTGLINEQGQGCYAFVHKTFQEYLCAEEINYQQEDEGDFSIVLNHIEDYLHNHHWREVLLLLIAQQKPKKAVKAIRKILNQNSLYESWLHRDLLFAGTCLAENPKDLKVADSSLPEEILEKLVDLEVTNPSRVGERVRAQVFRILCSLNETDYQEQALQLLKDRADEIEQERWQEYQAALGEKEAVITDLLAQLQDEDLAVRGSAAEALGNLGNTSEIVVSALLAQRQDQNSHVRWKVSEALGKLGNTSETVVSALLAQVQDQSFLVSLTAAQALGKLGNSSEVVVKILLAGLQDEDWHVRISAAQALGNLSNASETVVKALLARLQDKDLPVRYSAAEALGKLGNAAEPVAKTLLIQLQNKDWSVRSSAAEALGQSGNAAEPIINGLLSLLQDEDPVARWSAAEALGMLGNATKPVINALLSLLQDEDSTVRWSAAEALGKLGNATEPIINGLLSLLQLQNKDQFVRWSAAEALGKLGNATEPVINALLALLQDEYWLVRSSAAKALGMLGKKSSFVTAVVVEWIQQHEESEYVGAGIDALWDLVTGT